MASAPYMERETLRLRNAKDAFLRSGRQGGGVTKGSCNKSQRTERCGERSLQMRSGGRGLERDTNAERRTRVREIHKSDDREGVTMNQTDILWLVEYHTRVNAKILETAALLTEEELMREGEFDHSSAFQSMRHLVDVDWSWRQFCMGNDVGKTYYWEIVPMSNFAELNAAWMQESAELLAYVQGLDDAALAKPVVLNWEKDKTRPTWQVLAHVVNHGTQHRAELARYFTRCGHSPGDLDLL